ncbi:MAG: hypothetical protein F6K34_07020 [Okeania sp. SIO4D6]|nr:hypothetical protein [Okeania sp. SIO4D6]NEP43574.1 hypothetical protein [Okeania sp. SIO2H7]
MDSSNKLNNTSTKREALLRIDGGVVRSHHTPHSRLIIYSLKQFLK